MNSLFILKNKNLKKVNWFGIALFFVLPACQNIKTRDDIEAERLATPPAALKQDYAAGDSNQIKLVPDLNPNSNPNPLLSPSLANSPQAAASDQRTKIALILGPGGLRSYAHIGVIQELVKAKIPIYSITGMEMGSLVAAIFARKGQVYDVEWQMMKLKEEDVFKKNIVLSRGQGEVTILNDFIRNTLGNSNAEDAKVSFSCPAFNVTKRQIYIMNRGPFLSLLPYCIPYFPFFKPYQQNTAGLTSLVTTVKHLRSKGANYLVYVDLLNEKSTPYFSRSDSDENVNWSMVAQGLEQQMSAVNRVVLVPLTNYNLDDFSKRREMIQRGQEAGKNLVRELQAELGY